MIRLWTIVLLTAISAAADGLAWHSDLAEAQAQAKREQKAILIVFRGSAWCPPCIEMERQVFQSPEFISYARQSLVLVDVDFPEASAKNPGADGPTSPMNDKWREKLREKFNVGENFPTLVLLNESGQTEFQEAGYSGGGPAEVLRSLQRHAKPPSSLAAPAEFKNIGVEEFAKLAADAQNVILDVRTPQEFDSGHLAGAVNLDFNAPDFLERIKALDRRRTYLVHCASGGRSAKACGKLSQLDFPRLYNLAGGIHAWVKAGQPVVK